MKNKLEAIREKKGISRRELAEKVDSAYSTIYNFEREIADVSPKLLKRIAEVLEVKEEDILAAQLTGALEMNEGNRLSGDDAGGDVRFADLDPAPRKVPVVGFVAGANVLLNRAFNYTDMANQIEEMIGTDSRDPNALGLIVEGDSMDPEYQEGDRIVVAPNSEPRNRDVVVARLNEGGAAMLKRFFRTGPEGLTIRLESTNKNYKPIVKELAEFRFIYPVVDMRRKPRR